MTFIIDKAINKNTCLLLWEIDDKGKKSYDISLTDQDKKILKTITSEKRMTQFINVRLCLYHRLGVYPDAFYYDESGVPRLTNGFYISISHSGRYILIGYSNKNIGVDIEKVTDKTKKVLIKYDENPFFKDQTNDILTCLWTLKESSYKYFKTKGLSFKKHIIVNPFSKVCDKKKITIIQQDKSIDLLGNSWYVGDYILSWVL